MKTAALEAHLRAAEDPERKSMNQSIQAAAAAPHDLAIAALAATGAVCIVGAVAYLIAYVVVGVSERRCRRETAASKARPATAKPPEPSLDVQGRAMVLDLRRKADELEAALERRAVAARTDGGVPC